MQKSNPTYKILIVHAIPVNVRQTVIHHLYSFPAYRTGNIYAYQHALAPISAELKEFPFDAIILDYSFLAYRITELYQELREKYEFLRESPAFKIVISQDEFNSNEILDEWLSFLKVNVIYTPVDRNLDVLLPQCSKNIPIKFALAGYNHVKELARLEKFVRPFADRTIDVGSRVRHSPPHYGRAGVLKGESAVRFGKAAREAGFVVDISTDPGDVLLGEDWFNFLGSCRFAFATRGGVSVCDPRGTIGRKVAEFSKKRPDATFEEIEAACFPGLDRYDFSATTPRIFEAAALRTGLILVEDRYVEGLEPYKHYIPLKADFSNLDEVFALMRDDAAVHKMIDAAYQHLIENKQFSYQAYVDMILAEVEAAVPRPRPARAQQFSQLAEHYEQLAASQRLILEAPPHWSKVARFVGYRADRRGELGALSGLVSAIREDVHPQSLMAAQMIMGERLDPTLAGLAVEALRGLGQKRQDLDALAAVLAAAGQMDGFKNFHRDWGYCEYIYDPSPTAES